MRSLGFWHDGRSLTSSALSSTLRPSLRPQALLKQFRDPHSPFHLPPGVRGPADEVRRSTRQPRPCQLPSKLTSTLPPSDLHPRPWDPARSLATIPTPDLDGGPLVDRRDPFLHDPATSSWRRLGHISSRPVRTCQDGSTVAVVAAVARLHGVAAVCPGGDQEGQL